MREGAARRTRNAGRALRSIVIGAAACVAIGCSSNPPPGEDDGDAGHIEQALADYARMGFLAGTSELPVVGRIIRFRGPGDSSFVVLSASMPPAALRFARERGLFSGSYQVTATAVAGTDTALRLNRREIVRVEDFAETASDEERIFFQRIVTLPAGSYDLTLTVRELTTRSEASRTFALELPAAGSPEGRLSEPVVALRAVPREAYRQPPPLIASPRSTATASREPPLLVVEVYDAASDTLVLRAASDGELLWEQVLVPTAPSSPAGEPAPRTVLTTLPIDRVPPGLTELSVVTEEGVATRSPLLIAVDDEWAFADWERVVEHLAYSLSPDSMELWQDASILQRASLWAEYWDATDLDPDTPRNEFLQRYFDRMSEAEDRYPEPGIPGWRTDRGRTHVQLGEADREVLRGGGQTGEPRQIEWTYEESLPFGVRLRYVDESDFGIFRLEPRSRLVLRDAFRRLRQMERAGEWEGPDATDDGETPDEG